jgi:DNA phosphorothioation-associated putative methyltransferase
LAECARTRDAVGKRVGGVLYVHRDALALVPSGSARVAKAEAAAPLAEWNVAKIERYSVSLLLYEPFDVDFPALLRSTKVDLKSGAVTSTDYARRTNPPILHRKETLLPPDDPRLPKFRALTAAAEEHGLFAAANKTGTRAAWNARIEAVGLVLRNGRLLRADEEHLETYRHKTAIARRDLSQPMQLLMRFGIVTMSRSVFDYGCGQGADVEALATQGFDVFGWDPHHAPSGPRKPADVVNLGFVVNVIEDPRERVETLKAAWGFTQRALCVAVMPPSKATTAGHRPYRDGFVTSRGTFQRYFDQQELRALVQTTTGEAPLSLAPGIVAVFRDKDLEQEVQFRRRSGSLLTRELPRPPLGERPSTTPRVRGEHEFIERTPVRERIDSVLQMLRATAVGLGRLPEADEVQSVNLATLAAERVGVQRALDLLRDEVANDREFALAARTRRQDLLVHLALSQVPGAPRYKTLPRSLQTDIRAFFQSHAAGLKEGRRLLFAAGDRAGVKADAESAAAAGLGGFRGEKSFRFRASVLPRLPMRLRVMVGCAEVLQGGVEAADFVDIDLEAPGVTMIVCDDIEQPVPFVVERVRVDLGQLKVSADRREPQSTPIFFKSRYLPADDEMRRDQERFETVLAATGLFQKDHPEPHWSDVRAALKPAITNI